MAGVYQIYNTETGKRYIGSSIDVERRLKERKRNLKSHKHRNQHLQNAWNKYEEYLIFEALEYCEPDECLILEQKYIDYYDSANRKNGYNIDKQAASAGKHLSESSIKRYSDFNNRPDGFCIKCLFSSDIKYYPSLREASRKLGVDKNGIKYALRHKQGYMKKLNCTFVQIDKDEFLRNKVTGEK